MPCAVQGLFYVYVHVYHYEVATPLIYGWNSAHTVRLQTPNYQLFSTCKTLLCELKQ